MNLSLATLIKEKNDEERLIIESKLHEHNELWKSRMSEGWIERIAERRKLIFAMRKTGCSHDEIAKETGLSKATIIRDIQSVLEEYRNEMLTDAHLLIVQELERLDSLQNAFWESAMRGNDKAGNMVIKCMQERRALLGLGMFNKIDNEKDKDEKNTIIVQYVDDWRNPKALTPAEIDKATPDEHIVDVVQSDVF